jgi:hypothetical protein
LQSSTFISADLPYVEVFSYDSTNPDGVCLALPRATSASADIELLGIICMGKATGKACFWDNQIAQQQTPIKRGQPAELLKSFSGGPELDGGTGGICTSCHAGENPFVIHPRTALGMPALKGLRLKPDNFYQPLVSSAWPQSPGPSNILDGIDSVGSCSDCHNRVGSGGRFPKLSKELPGYCGTILPNAVKRTMPPGSPNDPDYFLHVKVLMEACNSP